jgi:hypothetical protein
MKISSWWRELTGIAKRSTFLSEMRRHILHNYPSDHGNRLFPDERRQSGGAEISRIAPIQHPIQTHKEKGGIDYAID